MSAAQPPFKQKPNVVIIGEGKVGRALTQLLELNRNPVELVGRSLSDQDAAVKCADIVLLCVNDGAIQAVCQQIAPSLKSESIVSHCSAALDSEILAAAKDANCHVASTHPLNTFPSIEAALKTFSSTAHQSYLYAEGDAQALPPLLSLFETLGFNTNTITREAKPLYHVACVFACNYLSSLMELSMRSAEAAGLARDLFWDSIQPIIYATLRNIDENGAAKSLSGPIARGDTGTIRSHLKALNSAPDAIKVSYSDLGIHALTLAIESGELDTQKAATIKELLRGT